MSNGIRGILNKEQLHSIKRSQYAEKLLLSDTVPAGQELRSKINISHTGDFQCLFVTGRFTTLALSDETVIDDGVCALRGQLLDGTGNRKLFNDFIPFDLLFSPGRIKSILAANYVLDDAAADRADPAQQLFFPFEFQHLFDRNSTIIIDVKNDSTYANSYDICFHGIRLM